MQCDCVEKRISVCQLNYRKYKKANVRRNVPADHKRFYKRGGHGVALPPRALASATPPAPPLPPPPRRKSYFLKEPFSFPVALKYF